MDAEAEGLILWPPNVKIQHTGKDSEVRRRRGQQRTRSLDDITNSMDMRLSKPWEMVKGREA